MAIFLDTKRAFDTVWNDRPLLKLSRLRVNSRMVNLIASYLEQCPFRVRVNRLVVRPFNHGRGAAGINYWTGPSFPVYG